MYVQTSKVTSGKTRHEDVKVIMEVSALVPSVATPLSKHSPLLLDSK